MLVGVRQDHVSSPARAARLTIDNGRFFAIAVGLETALVIAVSMVSGMLYHIVAYAELGSVLDFAKVGALTALLFTLPFIFRSQYCIEAFLGAKRGIAQLFNVWCYAFLCLAVLGFLTKTTDVMSRGWMVMFFCLGLVAVTGFDAAVGRWLAIGIRSGRVTARRLMVIGTAADIARFKHEHAAGDSGTRVVVTAPLPDYALADGLPDAQLRLKLASALDHARKSAVSDVVVLVGWQHNELLERITDCCMDLPATVHLGQLGAVSRYPGLHIDRMGSMTTLTLVRSPMTVLQLALKRLFDLVAASVALLLFSPLLVMVAVLIKLDSDGPVFFRQNRRGFNHKEFRIWKFRTMTTMENGDHVLQAHANDVRVTRVGRILRKTNIDELPQLFNVINGQMSLVGPRPHAVAHDKHYERCIARYARRLNVKPGITGWAQVHGLRGATQEPSAMRDRVDHDLYYIDNWSIILDLYIIAMTVASPRAYRNAE